MNWVRVGKWRLPGWTVWVALLVSFWLPVNSYQVIKEYIGWTGPACPEDMSDADCRHVLGVDDYGP